MAATVCRYPPPGREDVDLTAAQHLSRLAQGVNLRSATPQQVAELSQALYDSGHVSLTDHALLSFQPAMGQGFPGQQGDTQAARDVSAFGSSSWPSMSVRAIVAVRLTTGAF